MHASDRKQISFLGKVAGQRLQSRAVNYWYDAYTHYLDFDDGFIIICQKLYIYLSLSTTITQSY